ncbi:hypothetical protein EK51_004434 [Salmonella enterica subsp. enterica]|nr:hypothetical protein [Salmonella enterica subsp. enterica]
MKKLTQKQNQSQHSKSTNKHIRTLAIISGFCAMTNTAAAEDRKFIKHGEYYLRHPKPQRDYYDRYDDFVTTCKLNDGPCPDVLKPGASSNGYAQTYAYGNMYTKITTSPDLTIDGTTTTIKNLGYRTVPFCYSTTPPGVHLLIWHPQ